MIRKNVLPDGRVSVTFEMPASVWADSIHVVGDFNDWSSSAHPLTQRHDGTWQTTLILDAGRDYQFRYLINGVDWQNDWQADRYTPNPFSTENSVVRT
jgi:1,4-alpha-glucan branching enzyme